jgi:hypothetical protein
MNTLKDDLPEEDLKPGKDIKSYVDSRLELFIISFAEKIASTISASIQKTMGIVLLAVGALFLWIALGLFLGDLLDNNALGFLLSSLPLLLIGLILFKRSSKGLEAKIQSDIINKINPKILSNKENKNPNPGKNNINPNTKS